MSELKPCPFCGGEAKVEDHGSFKIVGCSKLSILCPNPRMAVYNSNFSHWNTRTESTELEQLRKERDESCLMDFIINDLFSSRWCGDSVTSSLEAMKKQLHKNLTDQVNGYWSGHTAYRIMVEGGFLIDAKHVNGKPKRLTKLGEIFMKEYQQGE